MANIDTTAFSTAGIMAAYGIPTSVWQPIQSVESGGNANAYTKTANEESVGLFQLNRQGGLGTNYSVAQLQNPTTNATIAAQAMAPAVKAGMAKGLTGYDLTQYVAFNSGFPTTMGVGALSTDPVVQNYNGMLQTAFSGGSSGSSTPTTTSSSSGILAGAKDTMVSGFWLLAGLVMVGFGVYVITNPLSNLSGIISKWNVGSGKAFDT